MNALNEALTLKDARVQKKVLFIFGISGFVGKRLARLCSTYLRAEFTSVSGTTRKRSGDTGQIAEYIEYVLEPDGSLPGDAVEALKHATHVLSTVPTTTDTTLNDGLIELLSKQGRLEWAGYLSTTGAYGDRSGGTVEEDDEIDEKQLSARGLERVRMEQKWLRSGAPVHIFRLPGIYGPGRGPLAKARELAQRLIFKEGQVFCRVHVDDIVQALVLSMRKPNPGRVYNVCDDEPAPSHEVSLFAYKMLDKTAPPLVRYEDVQKDLSPMLRSFYAECKRVKNDRIKLELSFWPLYPTYREGILAQLEEEEKTGFVAVPVTSAQPPQSFQRIKPLAIISRVLQVSTRAHKWLALHLLALYNLFRFWYIRHFLGLAIILVDNGSVRPGATLGMRRLASELESKLGCKVHPTSWRYSDRIDSSLLDGKPALLYGKTLQEEASKFVITIPLFLGPSVIVARDVPKLFNRSTQLIGTPLVNVDDPVECSITRLLERSTLGMVAAGEKITKVLMVDHGSPSKEVNRVRRALGARLRSALYPAKVVDCSMERREEAEYDFNEPTLEHAFELGGFDRGHVLVVPAFLFPGNHAGPGGDIENIVKAALERHVALKVTIGKLIMDQTNDDVILPMLSNTVYRALL